MIDDQNKLVTRRQVVQTAGGIAAISVTGLAGCGGGGDSAPKAPAPKSPSAAAAPEPAPAPAPASEPEPMAAAEPEPEPAPEAAAEEQSAAAEPEPAPKPDPESLPKLTEDDPAASALGYRNNAGDVDTAKYPNYQAGQQCRSCALFEGGDAAWGPCSIFPGKRVNANGWCATFAPKA